MLINVQLQNYVDLCIIAPASDRHGIVPFVPFSFKVRRPGFSTGQVFSTGRVFLLAGFFYRLGFSSD